MGDFEVSRNGLLLVPLKQTYKALSICRWTQARVRRHARRKDGCTYRNVKYVRETTAAIYTRPSFYGRSFRVVHRLALSNLRRSNSGNPWASRRLFRKPDLALRRAYLGTITAGVATGNKDADSLEGKLQEFITLLLIRVSQVVSMQTYQTMVLTCRFS